MYQSFITKLSEQEFDLRLSLRHEIAKANDGALKLNTIENKGSEFIIELPITI